MKQKMIQENESHLDYSNITFLNLDQNCANEKKTKEPFNFGKCKVCKDKATGIHYGIPSCEGCKGFFKRSVEKNEKYVCYFGFKCVITPKQRKRCKFCRWKACLAAGMSFEGIKMGRIPKLEKERAKYSNDSFSDDENESLVYSESDNSSAINSQIVSPDFYSNYTPESSSPVPETYHDHFKITLTDTPGFLNMSNILNSDVEKNRLLFSMLRDRCYQLYVQYADKYERQYDKALKVLGKLEGSLVNESIPTKNLFDNFIQETCYHTKSLYTYAKQLPGFENIYSQDFLKLMNSNIFIMFGLRTHKLFINGEHYLIHPNGVQFNRNNMYKALGIDLTNKILYYHSKLNSLNLTNQEIALLIPFILTGTKSDFVDPEALQYLNEYYKQSLMYEFTVNKRTHSFISQLAQYLSYTVEINTMAMNLKYPGP